MPHITNRAYGTLRFCKAMTEPVIAYTFSTDRQAGTYAVEVVVGLLAIEVASAV